MKRTQHASSFNALGSLFLIGACNSDSAATSFLYDAEVDAKPNVLADSSSSIPIDSSATTVSDAAIIANADAAPLASGELAPGWRVAFSATSAGINCNMTAAQMAAAGAQSLTFLESTIYVGFEQNGQNQNPVFARFDNGTKRYCEHHETQAPDGRAYGITWNGGASAYVVYTIVGGGSEFDSKSAGTWLSSYGNGGASSKVSYLGRVETEFGLLQKGTFIIAKKADGKTNSHTPISATIVLPDGRLELHGSSAFQPMNPDRTIMQCSGYPFYTKYIFSADLQLLTCSSSTNCLAKQPCL
jgi:hypothetical protein